MSADTGFDERIAALHDKAEEPLPESWKPTKPGEELAGTFVRLDKGTTSYGPCWIVVLESVKEPGKYASIWLFHTALLNQFKKARPTVGQLVLVRYEGKRKPKGDGNAYHDWKVLTESDGSGFSWDEFGGAPEPVVTDNHEDFHPSDDDSIPF